VQISGSNSPYPVDPNPIVDGGQIRLTYLGNFMQGETNKIVTATSSDGINFMEDGVIFTGDVYDPDLFYDEVGGEWVLFLNSGAGLTKATASSPTASFTEETGFIWTDGSISSTHKIGDKYYTYYYAGGGICVAEYTNGKLSNIADGIVDFPGMTADPTVAVFGPNDYKMFFKTVVGEEPPPTPEVIPHEPIYIDGNDNFTETNGVVSGDGTESNPYIIEGWDISASTTNGIEIKNTDVYFIIRNCEIHNNSDGGIYFQNVDNSTVSSNNISNNYYGIFLDSCHNNLFNLNTITDSVNGDGISMDNSSGNELRSNTIESSRYNGIGLFSSSNNLIYHNNLRDNAPNGYDDTGGNSWDNGAQGNYWGDYTGVDEDKDGIGDSAYEIPGGAGASDNCPLMEPYSPNNPPNLPSNPSPANHATGVSINTDLSWTGGDPDAGDTVTYDVYFGTISSPPLVSTDQSETTYDPGTLSYGTKYYWKIVATDSHAASAEGPLWDFTTRDLGQDEPSPELGFASLIAADKLEIAYGYKSGEGVGGWTVFNPDWAAYPELNTLSTLYKGRGYWVKVSEACTLTYGDNSYSLDAGWNLIGWLGWEFATSEHDNPAAADGLASILDELEIAYGYESGEGVGGWTVFNPDWAAYPELNTLSTLYKGRGYWIKVSEACTLTYGDNSYSLDAGWNLIGWVGW